MNATERNPMFYEISAVFEKSKSALVTYRYDPKFRQELTLRELAKAAGKLGENDAADVTYLRLWNEAKRKFIRFGYVPTITESSVELVKTPGRVAREMGAGSPR